MYFTQKNSGDQGWDHLTVDLATTLLPRDSCEKKVPMIKSEGRKPVEGKGNAELQGHGQETNLARHVENQGI
jgi:hypothetical protein